MVQVEIFLPTLFVTRWSAENVVQTIENTLYRKNVNSNILQYPHMNICQVSCSLMWDIFINWLFTTRHSYSFFSHDSIVSHRFKHLFLNIESIYFPILKTKHLIQSIIYGQCAPIIQAALPLRIAIERLCLKSKIKQWLSIARQCCWLSTGVIDKLFTCLSSWS